MSLFNETAKYSTHNSTKGLVNFKSQYLNPKNKKSSKSFLPNLNLTTYYKKNINNCDTNALLHYPLASDDDLEIKPRTVSVNTQKSQSKSIAKFISFQAIKEKNQQHLTPDPYISKEIPLNTQDSQDVNFNLTHNKLIFNKYDEDKSQIESHQLNHLKIQVKNNQYVQWLQRHIRNYPSQQKNHNIPEPHYQEENDSNDIAIPFNIPKEFFWLEINSTLGWKPDFREMSSTAQFNNIVYQYAGIGMEVRNDIIEIDLKMKSFTKISQKGDIPNPRYAHTILPVSYSIPISFSFNPVIIQKGQVPSSRCFLLFGGEMPFNAQLKLRECLNDVRLFNCDTGKWKYLRTNSDGVPEPRRSFGSTLISKGLLIHGGMTNRSHCLNDLYFLNLTLCKWVKISTQNDPYPQGIAFHSMISTYTKPLQVTVGDFRQQSQRKYKQEAIFCFGGCYLDEKTKQLAYYDHFVMMLKVDSNPPLWSIPEIEGIQPQSRIMHSTTYNAAINSIIIFSGRNDNNFEPYLNDIHILALDQMLWVQLRQVQHQGEIPKPRAGHCSFFYDNKLFVLGGINIEGYLATKLEIAETGKIIHQVQLILDKLKVRYLTDQYKIRQKNQGFQIDSSKLQNLEQQQNEKPPQDLKKSKKLSIQPQLNNVRQSTRNSQSQADKKKELQDKMNFVNFNNFKPLVPMISERERKLRSQNSFLEFRRSSMLIRNQSNSKELN